MPSGGQAQSPAEPKLPWYVLYILLCMVGLATFIKPFAPNGFLEYFWRLTGLPISLAIGHGGSLRFSERNQIGSSCLQAVDVAWSSDSRVIIVNCTTSLQAWTPDGRQLGSVSTDVWPIRKHLAILSNPLRVVYVSWGSQAGQEIRGLAIWNVETGRQSVQPAPSSEPVDVAIDPARQAAVVLNDNGRDVELTSLDDWHVERTIHLPVAARALFWSPSAQQALLGSFDGALFRADVLTDTVAEVASEYHVTFPGGGGAQGPVAGLQVDASGATVATYMEGGLVTPTPGTNTFDQTSYKKWKTEIGSSAEIRSLADGRLLARMPGPDDLAIDIMTRDPRDRFVAVAGHDSLILWSWQAQTTVAMTLPDPASTHGVAISPDGTLLALTTSHVVRLFRISEQPRS